MLRILIVIGIFLSVPFAYAGQHQHSFHSYVSHGSFNHNRVHYNRSFDFERHSDREFHRAWLEAHHGGEIVFFGVVSDPDYAAKHAAYPFYQLGLDDFHLRNFPQAIIDFTKAIEIYPQFARAYYFRGLAHMRLKDLINALADINRAEQLGYFKDISNYINSIKHIADQYYFEGLNDMSAGLYPQAIAEYSKAIEIFPTYQGAFYFRGITYFRQKDPVKALVDLNQAKDYGVFVDPALINVIQHPPAKQAAETKKLDILSQSIADMSQAIEIDTDNTGLYLKRGLLYKKQKNFPLAIADFTKAIEINPKYSYAFRARGVIYFMQKVYDKSWADLNIAQELGAPVKPEMLMTLKTVLGK